jgi:hypothetical protein
MNGQPNAEMAINAVKSNSVIPAAGMEKNPSKSELEKASTAIR